MGILIVDDSRIAQTVFETMLRESGYTQVVSANSAGEAFQLLGIGGSSTGVTIDLILMDIMMPEMDGIEACARIKQEERSHDIPVIIISGLEEMEKLNAAFAAGAADYITKPANKIELLARVRSALRLKQEMDRRKARETELLALTRQLEGLNQKLEDLSRLDGLTGIPNRRCFDDFIDREWKRGIRDGKPLSVVMIDIDFFKSYNDTYGHQTGDDCLKSVAAALQRLVRRPGDLVARYGGEEFVAVLTETGIFGASNIAESMCREISSLAIPHSGSSISDRVTISLGVATAVPVPEKNPSLLITAADAALYRAKQAGRNCFELGECI